MYAAVHEARYDAQGCPTDSYLWEDQESDAWLSRVETDAENQAVVNQLGCEVCRGQDERVVNANLEVGA